MPTNDSEIVSWLTPSELEAIPTSQSWNDEVRETAKAYDVRDGNFERIRKYLRDDSTRLQEFSEVCRLAEKSGFSIEGVGVDAAAGACWAAALLSRFPKVRKIYALDASKLRLTSLAPHAIRAMDGDPSKITRVLGSFYELRVADASVDFVLLAAAYHHADDADRLLRELTRALKAGGGILMIGEEPISAADVWLKRLKNLVKMALPSSMYKSPPVRKLMPTFADLYPPDPIDGDHYYRFQDYTKTFARHGFSLSWSRRPGFIVFFAMKGPERPA